MLILNICPLSSSCQSPKSAAGPDAAITAPLCNTYTKLVVDRLRMPLTCPLQVPWTTCPLFWIRETLHPAHRTKQPDPEIGWLIGTGSSCGLKVACVEDMTIPRGVECVGNSRTSCLGHMAASFGESRYGRSIVSLLLAKPRCPSGRVNRHRRREKAPSYSCVDGVFAAWRGQTTWYGLRQLPV